TAHLRAYPSAVADLVCVSFGRPAPIRFPPLGTAIAPFEYCHNFQWQISVISVARPNVKEYVFHVRANRTNGEAADGRAVGEEAGGGSILARRAWDSDDDVGLHQDHDAESAWGRAGAGCPLGSSPTVDCADTAGLGGKPACPCWQSSRVTNSMEQG